MGRTLNRALGFLRDLYNYPRFNRDQSADQSVNYRGVYQDFGSASAALEADKPRGFDSKNVVDYFAEHLSRFNPGDYPILLRLTQILRPGDTVFDLGGGSGQCYYAYRERIEFPPNLRWLVSDVEAFTQAGQKRARELGVTSLAFTNNWQDADGAPVYLTNGTLQYLEPELCEILGKLSKLPAHVLVNRIPAYDGQPFYTIQHGSNSYSPYKIVNTSEFLQGMEKLGYKKVDQWSLPRGLRVPFHPEREVPVYQGFYFTLR